MPIDDCQQEKFLLALGLFFSFLSQTFRGMSMKNLAEQAFVCYLDCAQPLLIGWTSCGTTRNHISFLNMGTFPACH